jgi:hypothetical protein
VKGIAKVILESPDAPFEIPPLALLVALLVSFGENRI